MTSNLASYYSVTGGVCKAMVLAPNWAPITAMSTGGSAALCTGAYGTRPGAGWSATWHRARVPCLTSRTIRAYRLDDLRVRRGGKVRRWRLDLAPGRDLVGEERS
jgi:hypothetical protein